MALYQTLVAGGVVANSLGGPLVARLSCGPLHRELLRRVHIVWVVLDALEKFLLLLAL